MTEEIAVMAEVNNEAKLLATIEESNKRIVELMRQVERYGKLLQQVHESRFWPEEGQMWGYLISEKLHSDIEDMLQEI